MAENITCEPVIPHDIESKARKMLKALLQGQRINRKNCDLFCIADRNDSIHSIASYLRHKKLIPLITDRKGRGTGTYYMNETEIKRYKSPEGRKDQIIEMLQGNDSKRKFEILKQVKKMVDFEYRRKLPDKKFLRKLKKIANQ
jgi:hypothetical protein